MIKNLNDLINYTHNYYKSLGSKECFSRVLINKSSDSPQQLKEINEQLYFLPNTYLNVIKNIDITGACIGYFNLSPSSLKQEGIVQQILEAKEDPFFPNEFIEKHRLHQVGFNNTDLIYVTSGTDQFKEGEVLFVEEGYDIYNPQDSQIHKIARDFEQFLIIAGNMHQIREEINEDESNYDEKKNEFLNRLKLLNVDPEYHNFWLSQI
jgi:hypothetical protein